MLANIEKQQRNNAINLHRSRSTIITSPRRRNSDDLGTSPAMALNVAPPLRYHIPLKLPSFNHIIESESTYERTRNINRSTHCNRL
ncbi:hypothetical protein O3M35_009906 [Rhynocoris fuscipes]|uniref:Uncharacterized protein n=1 Tax=Rhynocoris fuscipes TaxID=488301 RepID=A0AAW1D5F4_9HEMI